MPEPKEALKYGGEGEDVESDLCFTPYPWLNSQRADTPPSETLHVVPPQTNDKSRERGKMRQINVRFGSGEVFPYGRGTGLVINSDEQNENNTRL